MIPTPVEVAYNSHARFWCLTFEVGNFLMYLCYDDVNDYRSLQEWGTKTVREFPSLNKFVSTYSGA